MVRKRTRKYESDDNESDSDVELNFEPSHEPAAKKYSLRERKKTSIGPADFDYYGLDDEDGEGRRISSDDEDFEVEADIEGAQSYFEPDSDPPISEGLIDFEDIIRADIVVNKNKIDYDNLIQKSEIKFKEGGARRGRKPKSKLKEETDEEYKEMGETVSESEAKELNLLESENEATELPILQPEIALCEDQSENGNGDLPGKSEFLPKLDTVDGHIDPLLTMNDNIEKSDSTSISKIEKAVDKGPDIEPKEDDDVIVLEEKQDVIVLDD